MSTTIRHCLAAAALIGAATALAAGIDSEFDITRPGPDQPPPYQAVYKYKVKGSKAKGSEKYHMSVGTAFVGDQGISSSGSLEASRHDRPSFPFTVFAPVGDGVTTDSSTKVKYDSSRSTPEDTALDRDEFAFAIQRLDDDLGGTRNAQFKKPPIGVNGLFDVEQLKVKGRVRLSQSKLSGALSFSATGTVTSGEDQGKTFKASLRTRLKRAPFLD